MPFNLFENTDIVDQTKETLVSLRAKKKGSVTTLSSLIDYEDEYLELDNLGLQYLLGTKGLKPSTVYEIIGSEGIGKTTLMFTILGSLMRTSNTPCLYINTEGKHKLLSKDRIVRCLDRNPEVGKKMLGVLSIEIGKEIRQTVSLLEDWVKALRYEIAKPIPHEVPLVVVIDTLSKLMSPGEAAGIIDDNTSKKKELGLSSNLEFSKHLHYWCRRLPSFCDKENVTLIVVSHQNQKVSMTPFGGGGNSEATAGYNKTKIGGNALNQNAAAQITIKRLMFETDSNNNKIGHKAEMRVVKSSIGPDNRVVNYILKNKNFSDMDDYLEPAINFNAGLAEVMLEKKVIGTKSSRKRYTSEELGVNGVTSDEFINALYENKELLNKVGRILEINGYTPTPAVNLNESLVDEEEISEEEEEEINQDK